MNAIKWVDRENLTACIEAGVVGKDLSERYTCSLLCYVIPCLNSLALRSLG